MSEDHKTYTTIFYPDSKYLQKLKAELRMNGHAKIEISSRLRKNILRRPIQEFIKNAGLSFVAIAGFLINLRFFYSMLIMDIKGYKLRYKENGSIQVIIDNGKTGSESGDPLMNNPQKPGQNKISD